MFTNLIPGHFYWCHHGNKSCCQLKTIITYFVIPNICTIYNLILFYIWIYVYLSFCFSFSYIDTLIDKVHIMYFVYQCVLLEKYLWVPVKYKVLILFLFVCNWSGQNENQATVNQCNELQLSYKLAARKHFAHFGRFAGWNV